MEPKLTLGQLLKLKFLEQHRYVGLIRWILQVQAAKGVGYGQAIDIIYQMEEQG